MKIVNSIFTAADYIAELADKQTGMEYFETMVRYIFNVRGDIRPQDIETIAMKIKTTYHGIWFCGRLWQELFTAEQNVLL